MKVRSPIDLLGLLGFRAVCLGLLLPTFAMAQTTWTNGDGNDYWGASGNWNSGIPTSTSEARFNSSASGNNLVDIGLFGNRSAKNLNFNNVNDNFGLVNGEIWGFEIPSTLTLASGDITRTALSSNTQRLEFTNLALGGDAAMNINGTGSLTIASNIIDSGGARSLTKSGGGVLVLSGANTYSGGTTVSSGNLTLASDDALLATSSLTLTGGTLKLSTATTTVDALTITGNSIIDFGGANATLNVTTLNIVGNVTLSIINWVNAADFFYAANWTDVVNDLDNVVFSTPSPGSINYPGSSTKWQSYDHQITPVPEPATYGALLVAGMSGMMLWRRWRVSRQTV